MLNTSHSTIKYHLPNIRRSISFNEKKVLTSFHHPLPPEDFSLISASSCISPPNIRRSISFDENKVLTSFHHPLPPKDNFSLISALSCVSPPNTQKLVVQQESLTGHRNLARCHGHIQQEQILHPLAHQRHLTSFASSVPLH